MVHDYICVYYFKNKYYTIVSLCTHSSLYNWSATTGRRQNWKRRQSGDLCEQCVGHCVWQQMGKCWCYCGVPTAGISHSRLSHFMSKSTQKILILPGLSGTWLLHSVCWDTQQMCCLHSSSSPTAAPISLCRCVSISRVAIIKGLGPHMK